MAKMRRKIPVCLKFGPRIIYVFAAVSTLAVIILNVKVEISLNSSRASTYLNLQPNLRMTSRLSAQNDRLPNLTKTKGRQQEIFNRHTATTANKISSRSLVDKTRYSGAMHMVNGSAGKFLTKGDNREVSCQMPELDPFSTSVMKHIFWQNPLDCDGHYVTVIRNKQLVVRKMLERQIDFCYVSTIDNISDFRSVVSLPTKINVTGNASGDMTLQYTMSSDFTAVGCFDSNNTDAGVFNESSDFDNFYRENRGRFDLHAVVVPPSDVMQRFQTTKPPKDGLGLNVVMLALESTSRMNFIRQLPETYKLLGELGTIVLEGYNIVAQGSRAAVVPMLTGKTEQELPEVRKGQPGSNYVDVYPLIWNDFARNGYATMYAEDEPDLSTFGFGLNGFKSQPTDHYMNNLWNVANVTNDCLGSKPVHRVMLDYLSDYMAEYKNHPHFAFTFLVGLTHNYICRLQLLDSDLYEFVHNANARNRLNNTILILLGDHGFRFPPFRLTLQGRLEERLPFMSITLPKWVHKRYPVLHENLVKNTNRLATPFDIYETLQSVLHYNVKPVNVNQRGISLFNEIPPERTCSDADVAPHWCACLTWEPANPKLAIPAADALITMINNITEVTRDRCHQLKLKVVMRFEVASPKKQALLFQRARGNAILAGEDQIVDVAEQPTLYQVTFETTPGQGIFQGSVLVPPNQTNNTSAYQQAGEISRINLYGHQADCLLKFRPHLRKYCYCKDYNPQN